MIVTQSCGVLKVIRSSVIGGTMQECRVCGLLFLGGGACQSWLQVATDIDTDDIVMDENIPDLIRLLKQSEMIFLMILQKFFHWNGC